MVICFFIADASVRLTLNESLGSARAFAVVTGSASHLVLLNFIENSMDFLGLGVGVFFKMVFNAFHLLGRVGGAGLGGIGLLGVVVQSAFPLFQVSPGVLDQLFLLVQVVLSPF